jgi:prepilin-type N-terminal cleavage/methylation domain-containing protein
MVRCLKIRAGFSLMEMCVAMLIFGIALLLLMQFTLNAHMGSRDARSRFASSLSAEKKMRELRIAPYTVNGSDQDTIDRIVYDRSWSIKDTSFVKRIVITVTYKSLQGIDRNVTLTGVVK